MQLFNFYAAELPFRGQQDLWSRTSELSGSSRLQISYKSWNNCCCCAPNANCHFAYCCSSCSGPHCITHCSGMAASPLCKTVKLRSSSLCPLLKGASLSIVDPVSYRLVELLVFVVPILLHQQFYSVLEFIIASVASCCWIYLYTHHFPLLIGVCLHSLLCIKHFVAVVVSYYCLTLESNMGCLFLITCFHCFSPPSLQCQKCSL